MDFFSPKFDAVKALADPNVFLDASKYRIFATIDDFELYLCRTNPRLVRDLQKFELMEQKKQAKKLPVGRDREASLSKLCEKRGRIPIEPIRRRESKHLKGPLSLLERCVEHGHRVVIVLRGRNNINSFIRARIVAFDKHWNMLIRDGDESFKPSVKMRRRTNQESMKIRPHRYIESICEDKRGSKKTVWLRHLPCSLIHGDNIVLVSIPPHPKIDFAK